MIVSWVLASGESFICVATPTRANKMKRPFALGCWHLLVSGSRVCKRTAITLSIVRQNLERVAAHSPSFPPTFPIWEETWRGCLVIKNTSFALVEDLDSISRTHVWFTTVRNFRCRGSNRYLYNTHACKVTHSQAVVEQAFNLSCWRQRQADLLAQGQ